MPQFTLVRVVNVGEKDFVDSYNSERFVIKAGDPGGTFVPWDAAVIWFGNPRAVNNQKYPARDEEYNRILTRYGGFGDIAAWEANRPRVEVFTTDGERLFPVMDDPEGEKIPTADLRSADEQRDAEMIAMKAAIRELQAALANRGQEIEIGQSAEPLEDDTPQAPPVGPRDGSAGVPLTITHDDDADVDAP